MNKKTNLLEEYANFVDLTKKQKNALKKYNFICGYFMFALIFVFFN